MTTVFEFYFSLFLKLLPYSLMDKHSHSSPAAAGDTKPSTPLSVLSTFMTCSVYMCFPHEQTVDGREVGAVSVTFVFWWASTFLR